MTLEKDDIWKLVRQILSTFWYHSFKALQDGFLGRDAMGPLTETGENIFEEEEEKYLDKSIKLC